MPIEEASWVPFQELQSVTLDGGDGSGTIYTASPTVTVTASGASWMQVGTESGLADQPWQPLSLSFTYNFTPEEGEKHLYARFKDNAGNETEEIQASTTLVLRGTVNGQVMLEGGGDPSIVEVALIGTSFRAGAAKEGGFSISGVPAGTYLAEYRVLGEQASKWQPAQAVASVIAGGTTTLAAVTLLTARGDLVGTATLEEASEHGGILVEIVGTALSANTTVTGAKFFIRIYAGTNWWSNGSAGRWQRCGGSGTRASSRSTTSSRPRRRCSWCRSTTPAPASRR
ncbi:MAG: hypothetical protein V2A73_20350 [Pseudomonadota bacterium]